MIDVGVKVQTHFERKEYKESLSELARLRPDVDRFFEKVLVNCDDAALRENRLKLLSRLDQLMNKVADISKLSV